MSALVTLRLAEMAGWEVRTSETRGDSIVRFRGVLYQTMFPGKGDVLFRPWEDLTDCAELATALRKAGKLLRVEVKVSGDMCWCGVLVPGWPALITDVASTEALARFKALARAMGVEGA